MLQNSEANPNKSKLTLRYKLFHRASDLRKNINIYKTLHRISASQTEFIQYVNSAEGKNADKNLSQLSP